MLTHRVNAPERDRLNDAFVVVVVVLANIWHGGTSLPPPPTQSYLFSLSLSAHRYALVDRHV